MDNTPEGPWEILKRQQAVLRNDHFVYAKGGHGSEYVNKDTILPHWEDLSTLCLDIAQHFKDLDVEVVIGPVVAGAIIAQRVAEHLSRLTGKKVLAVYADKVGEDAQGNALFKIKRGYDKLVKDKRILVSEDILNTGGSALSVIELVRAAGGIVVGVGAINNRGGVTTEKLGDVPFAYWCTEVDMKNYPPDECPMCKAGIPINTQLGHGAGFVAKHGQPKVSV